MSRLRRLPRPFFAVIILFCYLPAMLLSLLFLHLLNTFVPMPLTLLLFLGLFIAFVTGLMATISLLELRTR